MNPQPSGLESDALTIAPWALVREWSLNRLPKYLSASCNENCYDPGVELFWWLEGYYPGVEPVKCIAKASVLFSLEAIGYQLAAIAQLGERQTEDLKVPGSIPGGGILLF